MAENGEFLDALGFFEQAIAKNPSVWLKPFWPK